MSGKRPVILKADAVNPFYSERGSSSNMLPRAFRQLSKLKGLRDGEPRMEADTSYREQKVPRLPVTLALPVRVKVSTPPRLRHSCGSRNPQNV